MFKIEESDTKFNQSVYNEPSSICQESDGFTINQMLIFGIFCVKYNTESYLRMFSLLDCFDGMVAMVDNFYKV